MPNSVTPHRALRVRAAPFLARRCRAPVFLMTVLAAALLGAVLPRPAAAAPVYTLLTDAAEDIPRNFAADLAQLWKERIVPAPAHLALKRSGASGERLRSLSRGRGHFTIVDVETAASRLPEYPRLTAVAVLWPNLLHALSRKPGRTLMRTGIRDEVWVFDNAPYPYPILSELNPGPREGEGGAVLLEAGLIPDALDYADGPVMLVSFPPGDERLARVLRKDPSLRLLPFSQRLLEEFKLNAPWLLTETLRKGGYPGLKKNLEVPALYRVLVGRRDLPDSAVEKMLAVLYESRRSMVMFNPLFGRLNPKLNAVFAKLISFHPVTAKRFDFIPSVP